MSKPKPKPKSNLNPPQRARKPVPFLLSFLIASNLICLSRAEPFSSVDLKHLRNLESEGVLQSSDQVNENGGDLSQSEQSYNENLGTKNSQSSVSTSPVGEGIQINQGSEQTTTTNSTNMTLGVFDIDSYIHHINNSISQTIDPNDPRIQPHIMTDKPVYKPGDIMFINVFLFDTIHHKPRQSYLTEMSNYGLYGSLQILDPNDVVLNSTYSESEQFTLSFTYEIPESAVAGDYKIVVDGSLMTQSIRVFRIRDYIEQQLQVSVELESENYNLGDTVSGQIKGQTVQGSLFEDEATFYMVAIAQPGNIEIERINGTLDSYTGVSNFSFVLPQSNSNITSVNLLATVTYQDLIEQQTLTFRISQPEQLYIEFFPENYNYAYNVSNKVYFQAFSNSEMVEYRDITNASLIGIINDSEQVILSGINSENIGRGSFIFTPLQGTEYYLELVSNLQETGTQRISLNLTQQLDIERWELSFYAENKVLENDEDLVINIFTNEVLDSSTVYVIGVFNKEQYLHIEQLFLEPNKSYQQRIPASKFVSPNGGVLLVNIMKILNPLIWYDRILPTIRANNFEVTEMDGVNILRSRLINPLYAFLNVPRGELLIFKKPSQQLSLQIITDKQHYQPGDLVTFEVIVLNKTTNLPVQDSSSFVNVYVTDESSFNQISQKQQPPSLPAMIYLENEIQLQNFEFNYASQYIDQWYSNDQLSASQNKPLDLLLGVQAWRYGFFFAQLFYQFRTRMQLNQFTKEELYILENLLATKNIGEQSQTTYYSTYSDSFSIGTPVSFAANAEKSQSNGGGGAAATSETTGTQQQETVSGNIGQSDQTPVTELTSSQREHELWKFIQKYLMCDFQENTRQYSHAQRLSFLSDIGSRFDLTKTLFYESAGQIKNGRYRGQFFLSDLVTQFRISANAFDIEGRLGIEKINFSSYLSFYLSMDLPTVMVSGDGLNIPIYLFNTLNSTINADLQIVGVDETIAVTLSDDSSNIVLDSNTNKASSLFLQALNVSDNAYLQVKGTAKSSSNQQYKDSVSGEVRIVSPGVQQVQSQTGIISYDSQRVEFIVTLPDSMVNDTLKFNVQVYPNNYEKLRTAIATLVSTPGNCLICVSGTAYSQILLLQSVTANNQSDDKVQTRNLLDANLQTILTFQNSDGSFSDFIGGSSDIMATAETLLLLQDASQVSSTFQSSVINSTITWILSQQDASGSFSVGPNYYYQQRPQYIIDAFILWVLSSANYTDIEQELNNLTTIADQQMSGVDASTFFLGLLGATYSNLGQDQQAKVYGDYLASIQSSDGSIPQTNTFFQSNSEQFTNNLEATAIATILWQNYYDDYAVEIQKAVNYLVKETRIGYYYYPTMQTILSLKVLTTQLKKVGSSTFQNFTGDFILEIDGVQVSNSSQLSSDFISIENRDIIALSVPDSSIYRQGQSVSIVLYVQLGENEQNNSNFSALYEIAIEYDDTNPKSSNSSSIGFELNQSVSNELFGDISMQNQLISYEVKLINLLSDQSVGLTVVVLRPPSCLVVSYRDLENLKLNKIIDEYELRENNSEIWLFFQGIEAAQTIDLNVAFTQRYSGVCQQRPQQAFEYYNNQNPVWVIK